jgi:CRISPR/Cas system CMR-associated protein Cmr5 small subunit
MNLQTITENLPQIISYLFGAGGVFAFFQVRKERQIAIKLGEANAIQGLQQAYDNFIKHSNEVIEDLKKEVKELKDQIQRTEESFMKYKEDCTIKH